MSSAEEDIGDTEANISRSAKKRRVQRACDVCRRKKIRCDGSQMPGNKCSNCAAYNFECKYEEAAKKRGPPKGYVESLELRLEKMEGLLQRLCPDADFTQELGAPIDRQRFVRDSLSRSLQNKPGTAAYRAPSQLPGGAGSSLDDTADLELESDDEPMDIQNRLQSLQETLDDLSLSHRFFGKSSGANLVQTALDLKSEYNGTDRNDRITLANRRPEFWSRHSWERTSLRLDTPRYNFPEPDLINHLVELYFSRINLFLPLLHRPTFELGLRDGLHFRDQAFGSVLLCLCACASRYSDDPRVLLDGSNAWHSSGWKWFVQVQMLRRSLMGPPALYDVQMYALACLFLQGCSTPQSCWTLVGVGIRLVQDVGKHRKRTYSTMSLAEGEQWRRAFWVLVVLDRLMSASFGRPCAIQEEDFDVDLPTEVDDEYWENEHESEQFKQPTGKPSTLSYFISLIKLIQILAIALRTIYSINKSKIFLGFVGPHWEQQIVAELDSSLNEWIDTVPGHLKWDTTGQNFKDLPCFLQSASLYSHYYHLQILVHRPFIPSPRKPSPLSFPSLAICTNAARSCAHVVDLQRRRAPQYPSSHFQLPAFTAGIVLLLSIWGTKRSGGVTDPAREMEDVHKCMAVLQAAEGRWHAAGRLWDVLYELASVGDLPLPMGSPSAKRERDSDSPVSMQSNTNASTGSRGPPLAPPPPPQQHPQRMSISPTTSSLGGGSSGTPFVDQLYSHPSEAFAQQRAPPDILSHPAQAQSFAYAHLPTHSDELGRVPSHMFQPAPETWLTQPPPPPAPHAHAHAHTHRLQHQHAAAPVYVPTPASHQQAAASYGTTPGAEAYTTFAASSSLGAPPPPTLSGQGQQGQDGNVDIWHTVPSGYECVLFPFYSGGAGGAPRVGDWLIGGTG